MHNNPPAGSLGAAFNKGLTFKMGQVHVHRYLKPLFEKIENGQNEKIITLTN